MNKPTLIACMIIGLGLCTAEAAPVIDGFLDTEIYGAPLAVQDTPTGFGNATNGHPRVAIGGSELNAAYAHIEEGVLYLFFAMNLETLAQGLDFPAGNGNTLDIFIDAFPGGQNSLRGDNADVDGNGLVRMGHLDAEQDGLKFDTGFDADFYFTFRNFTVVQDFGPGINNREVWRGKIEMATLPTASGGTGINLGVGADGFYNIYTASFTLQKGVRFGFRNSNTGGVNGVGEDDEEDTSDAINVTTGLELAIPLKLLGGPNSELSPDIKVCAFINNSDHGFLSNQVLGPLGQPSDGYGNLGEPKTLSFAIPEIPGDQFFAMGNDVESVRTVGSSLDGDTGEITLNWLAVPGDEFILEATEDLVDPEWTPMGTTVTSSTAYVQMITNFVPDRLYVRVAEQLP